MFLISFMIQRNVGRRTFCFIFIWHTPGLCFGKSPSLANDGLVRPDITRLSLIFIFLKRKKFFQHIRCRWVSWYHNYWQDLDSSGHLTDGAVYLVEVTHIKKMSTKSTNSHLVILNSLKLTSNMTQLLPVFELTKKKEITWIYLKLNFHYFRSALVRISPTTGLSFLAILAAPESPTWLARKGFYDKAHKGGLLASLDGGKKERTNEFLPRL